MKIKNVNFVELHIEKIVLALAVLLALFVLWFSVLSSYKVKLRGRKSIAVSKVEDEVRQSLKTLRRKMDSTERYVERVEVQKYRENFVARWKRPLLAQPNFQIPFGLGGLNPADVKPREQHLRSYAVKPPAAPGDLVVRSSHYVLLPRDELIDELLARRSEDEATGGFSVRQARMAATEYDGFVERASPRDFEAVTISASFDIDAWRDQLVADESTNRIPESWWRGRLLLTDVVLERQRLDEKTGTWPAGDEVEIVPPLPGAKSLRDKRIIETDLDPYESRELFDEVRYSQDLIAQPLFAPITEVRIWLPPSEQEAKLTNRQQRELFRINDDLRRKQKTILQLILRQENLEVRKAQREERRSIRDERSASDRDRNRRRDKRRRGSGGDPDEPDAFDGGGAGSERRVRRDEGQVIDTQIRRLEGEMQYLLIQKDELLFPMDETEQVDPNLRRLTRGPRPRVSPRRYPQSRGGRRPGFGMDPDEPDDMFGPPRGGFGGFGRLRGLSAPRHNIMQRRHPSRRRGAAVDEVELESQKIDVWGHDLTAKPGSTYRYRLRVRVLNPLFQQELLVPEQNDRFGRRLGLDSDPTPWSDPVRIEPKLHFYVVDAQLGGRAEVEVYRMSDGRRHKEIFTVSAGDPIGDVVEVFDFEGLSKKVDMRVGAVAVDVDVRTAHASFVGSTNVLMYFDQTNQQLAERFVENDKRDQMRMQLANEVAADESELGGEERAPSRPQRGPTRRGQRGGRYRGIDPTEPMF